MWSTRFPVQRPTWKPFQGNWLEEILTTRINIQWLMRTRGRMKAIWRIGGILWEIHSLTSVFADEMRWGSNKFAVTCRRRRRRRLLDEVSHMTAVSRCWLIGSSSLKTSIFKVSEGRAFSERKREREGQWPRSLVELSSLNHIYIYIKIFIHIREYWMCSSEMPSFTQTVRSLLQININALPSL